MFVTSLVHLLVFKSVVKCGGWMCPCVSVSHWFLWTRLWMMTSTAQSSFDEMVFQTVFVSQCSAPVSKSGMPHICGLSCFTPPACDSQFSCWGTPVQHCQLEILFLLWISSFQNENKCLMFPSCSHCKNSLLYWSLIITVNCNCKLWSF